MLFKPKKYKDRKSPPLYLCTNQLVYVDNCRYLGIKIETYFFSDDDKVHLFKSYCTNLYCTQFWYDSFAIFTNKTICRL